MTEGLSAEDYDKLYEDGLLRHTLAVEALLADNAQETTKTTRNTAARVLITRAHLDGILQQQSRSKHASRRLRASAEALRHQWQMEEAAKTPQISREQSLWKPSQQQSTSHQACQRNTNVANMFSGTLEEFFEVYPESMRDDISHNDTVASSDDDDDDDDEEQQQPDPKRTAPPLHKKRLDQEVITVMDDSQLLERQTTHQQQQKQVNPHRPAATANPYERKKTEEVVRTAPPPPEPSVSRPSSSNSQLSNGRMVGFSYTPVETDSVDNRQSQPPPPRRHNMNDYNFAQRRQPPPLQVHQDHSSWEDHQRKNPFQTAREFSSSVQDRPEDRQQQQQPQHQQQQHSSRNPHAYESSFRSQHQQQHNTHKNPYAQELEPLATTPTIPESLKRKFQAPLKKSGLASASQSSTKQVSQKQTQKKRETKKEDEQDEDDLPEELKRFGKELVQKIEDEIMDGGDPITFDDIAGLQDAKQTIQEVICWPMKRPDLFTGLRRAPNGLLLYGPPGTGKTLIGKAIAHESGATFFSISSSSLTSKWIGEGEKLVRTMFAVAAYREPSVVFIDEIDSLLTQRKSDENEASRRIKTEFLVQLDGTGTTAQGRVLTIGATNRPQELDEAARRRFVKRLYIPLPVESDRATLLRVLLEKNNHRLTEADVSKLAKETEGYSGADLKALCADAAMGPIRMLGSKALEVEAADVPPISYKHCRQSLRSMKPSVASSDLVQYEEWDKIYGSKRVQEGTDEYSSDED